MRRLASRLQVVGFLLLAAPLIACGGRDAHDIAADFEGTVSSGTVDRLLRDVDLQRAPVAISVDREETQTFGAADQAALETALRDAANEMQGDRVQITQQVIEDTGANTQQLTVTLSVEHQGQSARYVPVTMDLLRDGRRLLITQVHVMSGGH
jgi:hypothetical protein